MQIVGIQNNSFVDYPGKIAMVLFAFGCNMNCYYCHNRNIIGGRPPKVVYAPEFILNELEKKKDFLDAVVITGGEPTLNDDLPEFIAKIKEKNLLVKLDTNGTNPKMLKELIKKNLVDYIAMDIKTTKEKYHEYYSSVGARLGAPVIAREAKQSSGFLNNIEQSILLIKNSNIPHEFRTTFDPTLTKEDIIEIAKWLAEDDIPQKYTIQQFRNPQNKYIDKRLALPPHPKEYLEQTLKSVAKIIPSATLRGI
ncbi:MAG: anaerobic ribonucleoside-triphosphate reductase activating protein [Oscillospiraceae bacterium]|nr:anaerobic ribonucleoside-triphosphate reductase activating protein [Oscillospiraceae bacterium]